MTHLVKSFFSKLKQLHKSIIDAIIESRIKQAQYYAARATINELNSLTDKELSDIGISRGDIYTIAMNKAESNLKRA